MDELQHPLVTSPPVESPGELTSSLTSTKTPVDEQPILSPVRARSKSVAFIQAWTPTNMETRKARSWEPTLEKAIRAIVSIKASHVRSFDTETSGKVYI